MKRMFGDADEGLDSGLVLVMVKPPLVWWFTRRIVGVVEAWLGRMVMGVVRGGRGGCDILEVVWGMEGLVGSNVR